MGWKIRGGPKLLTGLMNCNGVVGGADAHHQHHIDEREVGEVYNGSGEDIMAPRAGIIGQQLSYRSTMADDEAPRAAAYDHDAHPARLEDGE